ncbi:MAG: AI-2E family transporter [Candidatus Riflebacteria bacterium]|nr:AI-2E family transporter [Candidatus Riflebacteria bacterium]
MYLKVLPWALLAVTAAVLRDFWSLIFLTFVVGSLMNAIVTKIVTRTGRPWRRTLCLSYIVLVTIIVTTLILILPRAWRQGIHFGKDQLPQFKAQVEQYILDHTDKENYSKMREAIGRHIEELSPARVLTDAARIVQAFGRILLFVFLSMVFSFLILFDTTFVIEGAHCLRKSRLGWIYCEVEAPVVEFFRIVGKVFDAQIVIAVVNTTLTAVGMLVLGIPGVLFLSIVVFLCGLIPVIGAFLSSVPILITALVQPPGIILVIKGLVMILLVHAIEAYVLNPRIMGEHLHLPPLVVMVSLLVGEHFFGIWGVLLGVPGITYVIHWFAKQGARSGCPAAEPLRPAPPPADG